MRLIDADMLLNSFKGAKKLGVDAIKYYVDNTPTIDLIRCGECKHWYNDADCGMACEFTNMAQPSDGFCNWGERANNTRTESL